LKAHDEVKFLIAQMVRLWVANIARNEVRLSAARGTVTAMLPTSTADRTSFLLEITRVALTQASISGSGVLAGPDAVLSILRASERERRRYARISAVVERDEGNTLFIPIVLTSCGGFGPSAQKYSMYISVRARRKQFQRHGCLEA